MAASPPPAGDRSWFARRRGLLLAAAALVVLSSAGAHWWLDTGNRLFFPKQWGVVVPGEIYRSGRIHRRLVEDTLRDHRIAAVVDLTGGKEGDPDVEAEREAARRLGIRTVVVPDLAGDGIGPIEGYVTTLTEMAKASRDHPLLVHCAGGSERTGASVAYYRMLFQGWDGARAWDEYLSFRREPPEDDRLLRYVNAHMTYVVDRLVEGGVLDEKPAALPAFGPADTVP